MCSCLSCCIISALAEQDTLDNKQEYIFTNKTLVKTKSNFIKNNTKYLILISLIALIIKIYCIMLLEYTKNYTLIICNG